MQSALWNVRAKWYNLGLALRLKPGDLDAINVRHQRDPDDCFTDMLKQWLQNSEATVYVLHKALKSLPVAT